MYRILDLPQVPKELILPIEQVLELENIFGGKSKNYTIHEVQDDLRVWLQKIFPNNIKFRYQTLVDGVPIHRDRGRDTALNYIIDTGGENVQTVWYDKDKVKITHSVILTSGVWHELQVNHYHTVTNIQGRRFAITVSNTAKL